MASGLRAAPLRYVVARDPSGRRQDAAFCCTDLAVSAAFILETYAKPWTLEVTFFVLKQVLGLDEPQNQAALAVRRTAPFAGVVLALVVLGYAREVEAGRPVAWPVRPWYRRTAAPAFADVLAALRGAGAGRAGGGRPPLGLSAPPCVARRPRKPRLRRQAIRCLRQ